MDTKLKNNHKKRVIITIIVFLAVVLGNICIYPFVGAKAQKGQESISVDYEEVNKDVLETLYHGCYVLYLEGKQQKEEKPTEAWEVFLKSDKETCTALDQDEINNILAEWGDFFETYRTFVDYYATDGIVEKKNTEHSIEEAVKETPNEETLQNLLEYYEYCFVLDFDENGALQVRVLAAGVSGDILIKAFEQIDRQESLQEQIENYALDYDSNIVSDRIHSFQVVFGIPYDVSEEVGLYYDYYNSDLYWEIRSETETGCLYLISLVLLILLAALMTSRKMWKDITSFERPGNWYVMEAGLVGIIVVMSFYELFCDSIYEYSVGFGTDDILTVLMLAFQGKVNFWGVFWEIFAQSVIIYAAAYATILSFRPLFSLGVREYIRQYSFLYQIYPWLKKQWKSFTSEVNHIDFSEKSTKTIVKIVILNFLVLAVLMCMWMFGIVGLIVYSVILFFLIKKYYDRISKDYRILLQATNRIAEGDLNTIIVEDIGVFEPFKAELFKIRTGFKKAVEEETKSQRMKTELITNVSHDLKTPLTAITTYVELLKKEDITEEERRSYIDTLDKKSLRLKVLIEDLFEVSKVTSNNITLNRMDVDVVNLIKQVSIEHTDKYEQAGIELRWRVPEEKVILYLDNQKTYRIFENLFVNIQKYAMPNSRVYIDVEKLEEGVWVTLKNMSAFELNVRPEELTERFVRGDASRNTEGSGLGLAIARSFTEAQGGKLHVEVDGDLFKVVIEWKYSEIQKEASI